MNRKLEPGPCAFAVLAGAGLVAGLHALCFPGSGPEFLPGVKFLLAATGDLAAAMLVLLAWMLLPRLRPSGRTSAFWIGVALGIGPWATSWLFTFISLPAGIVGRALPPVTGLAIVGLCVFILPRRFVRDPGRLSNAALALSALLLWSLLFFGVGVPDHLPLPSMPTSTTAGPEGPQPDVLLVSIDTLRADVVLDPAVETPTLDAWAAAGIHSAYALVSSPSTVPSHISMLSGLDPLQHKAWHNWDPVPDGLPTLAHWLGAGGWRTAAVVSNPLLVKEDKTGFARGFEIYLDARRRRDAFNPWTRLARMEHFGIAKAGTWQGWLLPKSMTGGLNAGIVERRRPPLKKRGGSVGRATLEAATSLMADLQAEAQPYFLFLHFHDPHYPYKPDPSVAGRLGADPELPQWFKELENENLFTASRKLESMLQSEPGKALPTVNQLHGLYNEEVLFVDACMQALLEQVRQSGRPTILIFTSDHGEQFGEHGHMFHGNTVYEPLLRVPFFMAGPGLAAGTTLNRIPRLEDIAPTVLEWTGLPVPPELAGVNLLENEPLANQPSSLALMAEGFAFRVDSWKLLGTVRREGGRYFDVRGLEFYNVEADPEETENVISSQAEIATQLLAVVKAAFAGAEAGADQEAAPEFRTALEELGYMDTLDPEPGGRD